MQRATRSGQRGQRHVRRHVRYGHTPARTCAVCTRPGLHSVESLSHSPRYATALHLASGYSPHTRPVARPAPEDVKLFTAVGT